MNKFLIGLTFLLCVFHQSATAQSAQAYGGITSVKAVAAASTSSDASDTLYIGLGTHNIVGTWEIYSKYVVIDARAIITGGGTIAFFNPAGISSYYSGANFIDGNNLTAAMDVNIEIRNTSGIAIKEITFGHEMTTLGGGFADNTANNTLYIGQNLNLFVNGADFTLGTVVPGDLKLDASATISNYGVNRMVIVNNSIVSHLVKESFTTAFTFPVGIADGDYTPVQITNTAANTVSVSVQDYTASIAAESGDDGINRSWHIFGAAVGSGSIINMQHNSITNQAAFTDASHFVTQWSSTIPNTSGDVTVPFSLTAWQINTVGAGTLGTLASSGSIAGSSMRSRSYAALATTAAANESYFSKSADAIHPLPVNLVSFTASSSACKVSLNWASGVESNMRAYKVMHSTNGTDYTVIATIPAMGSNKQYAYLHSGAANGNNVYRLQMTELDESYAVSPVVNVMMDCREGNTSIAISVAPNPTVGEIHITGLVRDTENLIQVLNMHGQVLRIFKTVNDSETFDISELKPASYVIRVLRNNEVKFNTQIVKQ